MEWSFRAAAELVTRIYAGVAGAVFLVSGLLYLCLGHWQVTHLDFWRIYDVCLNRSWLESALLKYNGHSHFFPSQLWLADLRFCHGNMELLFVAGLVLLGLTVAGLIVVVWGDAQIGLSSKILATFVIIAANFWMGRATTTASGGFNCCYSLTLGGVVLAFLGLRLLPASAHPVGLTCGIVIAAVVSSFSFATGLALWPTLLFLGYCMRFRLHRLVVLGLAGIVTAAVFVSLPSREASGGLMLGPDVAAAFIKLPGLLCRLIGSPIAHVVGAWFDDKTARELIDASGFSLYVGALGAALSGLIVFNCLRQRNLGRSSVELTGSALLAFNLIALSLIVLGRSQRMFSIPAETMAPRYLFWSSLLWAGILVVMIAQAETIHWLRAPTWVVILAAPIVLFPSHFKEGLRWRYIRCRSDSGAIALLNGVQDSERAQFLAPYTDIVYRVGGQMRARRLDFFAPGYQEWIGRSAADLFGDREAPRACTWHCRVDKTVTAHDGIAARLFGIAPRGENTRAELFVVLDPNGVVRGLARACSTSALLNTVLYLNRAPNTTLTGYVRSYDPALQYTLRCVEDGKLSTGTTRLPATMPRQ